MQEDAPLTQQQLSSMDQAIGAASPLLGALRPPSKAYPAWYTPRRLLVLFCWVSFLVYLDRGVLSSNGVNGDPHRGITGEFKLNDVQDGFLPAAFLLGLLIATVVYSELAKTYNAFRLIGVGFVIWTLCSVACGLAPGFWSFLAARTIMGAGEASIVNLTGPFIDDIAPPQQKTLWFGILFLFPTLGIAGGYIFGGVLGITYGWRVPFFVQALIALPVVGFLLLAPPVELKDMHGPEMGEQASEPVAQEEAEEDAGGQSREDMRTLSKGTGMLHDLHVLACHPVFVFSCLANCPGNGVFGALSYWGPHAGNELFRQPEEVIDSSFGVVTIVTAIVATLAGAWLVDRLGSSIRSSMLCAALLHVFRFCAGGALAGWVLLEAAFAVRGSFSLFLGLFALGELVWFTSTAPSMTVTVWSVPTRLRPLASGMVQVTSHVLGDVPAPPLVGLLQGFTKDWRWTMGITCGGMVLAGALYLIGAFVPCTDYRALREGPLKDAAYHETEEEDTPSMHHHHSAA